MSGYHGLDLRGFFHNIDVQKAKPKWPNLSVNALDAVLACGTQAQLSDSTNFMFVSRWKTLSKVVIFCPAPPTGVVEQTQSNGNDKVL